MNQVLPTALSANFDLIADAGGGSRIDMECRYAAGGRAYTGEYSLWITTVNGAQSHLATWTAKPGDVVSESALIDASPQDIRQVDIRSTATQQVLLSSVL
jgi:hypothetical protein